METLSTPKKAKVVTVRKANYFVLVLPIAVLLFTLWIFLFAITSFQYSVGQTQETNNSERPHIFEVVLYGLVELIGIGYVAQKFYRNKKSLTVEDISSIAWLTSLFIWKLGDYLQFGLFFLSLLLWDFIAILMIITLMHGEPFGIMSLYQNKRIIVRE